MTNKSVRWAFNLSRWKPTHPEILHATSCVQMEEKERLGRFVFKIDLLSSLIGRLMLRKFVNEACNKPYNEIKFIRDDRGKPVLKDIESYPKINFNISHQGGFVVLAGESSNDKLGIDVMKMEYTGGKPLSEFFRLMTRHFSNFEWETIKSSGSEKNQTLMFYRHWCLKESYVKAIGVGITVNLQEISFKITTKVLKTDFIVNDTELYVKGKKVSDWSFQELLADEDHCVAVAINTANFEVASFRELTYSELMENSVSLLPYDQEYCNNYFKKMDKV